MRPTLLLSLVSGGALAGALSSLMVTYPDQFAYYEQLQEVIGELSGTITHEYTLFNGFSLDLPEEAVDQLVDMNQHFGWGLDIEMDQEVHALGGSQ